MPTTSLPVLEQRLESCLLELEKTHRTRPGLPTAMARAAAGQKIDRLYEEMVELQQQIDASPAETLQDAAVKLRRLGAYVGGRQAHEAPGRRSGGRGAGSRRAPTLGQAPDTSKT